LLVRLQIVGDDGTVVADDEILHLSKQTDRLEALGLSLDEAKRMLRITQKHLLAAHSGDYTARHRACSACGQVRRSKGMTTIRFRTLFGTVGLPSRRLHHCRCHPDAGRSFSPLARLLTQHAAPELLFLEAKWASLVSYGVTADLLTDVLPVAATTNPIVAHRAAA